MNSLMTKLNSSFENTVLLELGMMFTNSFKKTKRIYYLKVKQRLTLNKIQEIFLNFKHFSDCSQTIMTWIQFDKNLERALEGDDML